MENFENSVQIPSGYFLKNVNNHYSSLQIALIRELIQNSVDAQATEIHLEFYDDRYVCKDNGKGMTKERMISSLLTMGGSYKEANSIGGFGEAKVLILFCMKKYCIHSNDIEATGQQLSYNIRNKEKIKGTIITGWYDEGFRKNHLEHTAREFVSNCSTNVKIYVNNELCKQRKIPKNSYDSNSFVVFFKRENVGAKKAIIQSHGVMMFERYIERTPYDIVIELKKPSSEILSSSRDYFKSSKEFESVIQKIISEDVSFGRNKFTSKVFDGKLKHLLEKEEAIKGVELKIFEKIGKYPTEDFVKLSSFEDKAMALKTIARFDFDQKDLEEISNVIDLSQILQHSFTIDVDMDYSKKIGAKFFPETMGKKEKLLALSWKLMVKSIMQENDITCRIRCGFTFSKIKLATFQNRIGCNIISINPTNQDVKFEKTKKFFTNIMMLACHELTHFFVQNHGEEFTAKFEKMLLKSLCSIDQDLFFSKLKEMQL